MPRRLPSLDRTGREGVLTASQVSFVTTERLGEVSALLRRPPDARCLLAFAHGARAGISHPFMEVMSELLAREGVATLRYQFPYMERGHRAPDRPPVLTETVRAAVRQARELADGLPVLAGGKSMGGRMTSLAASQEALEGVKGIVFFGFPLHPAGRPSTDRAEHLDQVTVPMLFLQGTRDRLTELELLRPVCESLGARATLQVIEGGDHSFRVLKRSGRTDQEVLEEAATGVARWAGSLA
jgi:predicted alpha/beta-hydrolase family hydrolase